jgi:hypothetical protein
MKYLVKTFVLFLVLSLAGFKARAIDINLINVDIQSPESQKLSNLYGDAYGFPAEQVAPTLLGPPEEAPAILQIAQAAGTVPTSVWMMRRMGMSYSRILQTFALGPTALMSPTVVPVAYSAPGWYSPQWGMAMDPLLVQTARVTFLRKVLLVNPLFLPRLPYRGIDFNRAILYPVHGVWMPPGIAKKYGLWMPPGQAKKHGWGGPWWGGPAGKWDGRDYDDWEKWEFKDDKIKGKGPGWKYEAKNGKVKYEAKGPKNGGHGKGKNK